MFLVNLIRFIFSLLQQFVFMRGNTIDLKRMTHLIVGLGNPDPAYDKTRHNIGKMFVKHMVNRLKIPLQNTRDGHIAVLTSGNNQIVFLATKCFMNVSGIPLRSILNQRAISLQNIIIVHDDLDTVLGSVKYKFGGSASGHNGLKSIIRTVETTEFPRLRIGIGRPNSKDPVAVSDYVLSRFMKDELGTIESQCYNEAYRILTEKKYL